MDTPWMDLTLRLNSPAEIDLLPDGTVELTWSAAKGVEGGLTVILSSAEFRALLDKGRDLLMVGAVGMPT